MKELITSEQLARYLTRAMNSDIVKKIIISANSSTNAGLYSQELGNYLTKYYISTLDNSNDGINKVCNLFIDFMYGHKDKRTFDIAYMSLIIEKISNKKIKDISIGEMIKYVEIVSLNNFNNRFFTHCFPGALYPEISKNGLNIDKELFRVELSLLEKYFKTAYKKGKLCYCELSGASLSYANKGIPERIKFALGLLNEPSNKETKHASVLSAFKDNLDELMDLGSISLSEYKVLYMAGKKIIDFYCLEPTAGVAIFRRDNEWKDRKVKFEDLKFQYHPFGKALLGKKIEELIDQCIKNPRNASSILDKGLNEIEKLMPGSKDVLREYLFTKLIDYMRHFAIANYEHGGMADGYEVASGKMSSDKYAISLIPCPLDLWIESRNLEHISSKDVPKSEDTLKTKLEKMNDILRVLNNALKVKPDRIEYIEELKIPIYINGNSVVFPNNYCLGMKDGAYILVNLSEKALANKVAYDMAMALDKEQISSIIEQYKKTDEYEEDMSEKELKDFATVWYAKEMFETYDDKTKKKMMRDTASMRELTTVKIENSIYRVTRKGETTIIPRNVLVDVHGEAKYNSLWTQSLEAIQKKDV